MKKTLLFVIVGIVSIITVNPQDTITFRNGDEVIAKVTEVGDSEIKYHLWSNPNGPIFVKKVADIFMVKYQGGHKDVYHQNVQVISNKVDKIMYLRSGSLRINDKILSNEDLVKILTVDEFSTYKSASVQRKIGIAFFSPALVLGFAGGFIISTNPTIGLSFIGVGAVLEMVGFPMFFFNNSRLHWVVRSYNGRISGDNVSLSIEPTFFHNYSIDGQSAYGIGITLNF